ncbi:MAG: putative transposase [Clostridium sp.]|jgi:putative transposase
MSRKARVKVDDAIFHIMCKSITEVSLFRDAEDKERYLLITNKYRKLYKVKIYGYCLMDNHAHLLVDANGADISKVMHGINFSYAMYFNKKYKRDGHLFKDRFKSKIVYDEKYLKTVSLYIHNNPTDIGEFKDCPEKYAFSSLGIYIGKRRDPFNIVDYEFVMGFFGNDLESARINYCSLVFGFNKEKMEEEIEQKHEKAVFKNERRIITRNFKPEDIVEFIISRLNLPKMKNYIKYSRNFVEARALTVVLMRSLCNFKSSDICAILGNISPARVSKLSDIGVEYIETKEKHKNIIEDFIKCYVC